MGKLDGKVAFITGAGRGQGRSHAVRLAEEGADIIAIDISGPDADVDLAYPAATEEDLAETAELVRAAGRRVVAETVDVRDYAALDDALQRGVEALGRLDVVVANAGVLLLGKKTYEVSELEWDVVVDTNLKGVWHTCKAASRHLMAHGDGGSVVLTSSTGGIKGTPNFSAYVASKHGVVGLMRTLARELGPYWIRVNTIHPTGVSTDMFLNEAMYGLFVPDVEQPTLEDVLPSFRQMNVLPTPWVEPADVSNAVAFLASDDARFITGTELKIDAGYCIK